MHVRLIINRRAGAALRMDADDMKRRAEAAFTQAGTAADVRIVGPEDIGAEIRSALARDTPIIVGGGDGTVRSAAAQMISTGVPLGVLPLGTMNLLARDLGIPLDVDEALQTLAAADVSRMDAASVNGDIYLCNSLMGLPAIFSSQRETLRGTGLIDGIRHSFALAHRLASLRNRVSVELDDGIRLKKMRVMAASISNNPYCGSDAVGLRRPRLDTGTLGIYASRHRTGVSAAYALIRAYVRTWRDDVYVSEHFSKRLQINSRRSRILLSNDGESRYYDTPLVYQSHPGALAVMVPSRKTDRSQARSQAISQEYQLDDAADPEPA